MKIDDSRAAVRRYTIGCSPAEDSPVFGRPEDYGPVHALLVDHPELWHRNKLERLTWRRGTQYVEYAWDAPGAVCCVPVRVVFQTAFETSEDRACPQCASLLTLRSVDADAYLRRRRLIEEDRRDRELRWQQRKTDRALGVDDFDEFYERRARGLGDISEGADLLDPATWMFPHLDADPSAKDETG